MSSSSNPVNNPHPNYGQSGGATPTAPQPTSSHTLVGPVSSTGPMHAAGAHSVNLQLPTPPMDETLQKAIQEYVNKLSIDDKAAFHSAPDVIECLQEMQRNSKPISSSLTTRVERVLQCIKNFMGSLKIFIQHSPEISSLVVGGVNCILMVGTSSLVVLATRNSPEPKLIYYYLACLGVYWVLWASYSNDGTHRNPPFLPHGV